MVAENDCSQEIAQQIPYDDIQGMIDGMLGEQSFSVRDYLSELIQGHSPISVLEIGQTIGDGIISNFQNQRSYFLYVILICCVGALLFSFSKLMQGKEIAKTAFYSVYMLLFSLFAVAFVNTSSMAKETLSNLLSFMKVLTPAYMIGMSFCQSIAVSSGYYQCALMMITIVDLMIVNFLMPGIHLFFMLQMLNQLSSEATFQKMADFLRDLIKLFLKVIFGVITGMNVIQGLILPVSAQVQGSLVVKVGSSIPGVGSMIGNITSTVLCAGRLVRNAVGVVGVIAIVLLCVIPLLQVVLTRYLYQLTGALIQPISSPQIVRCFSAMTDSLELLAQTMGTAVLLFVVSIIVVSSMT